MSKSEYERVRDAVEGEAVESGAMSRDAVDAARTAGRFVAERTGLTPERVWALTRGMRREGNYSLLSQYAWYGKETI